MTPKTRAENFLALIAGDPDAVAMTPNTREEYYMNEIAKNSPLVATFTHIATKDLDKCDLTWAELKAAIMAKKMVVAKIDKGSQAAPAAVYLYLAKYNLGTTGEVVFQSDVWGASFNASTGPAAHTYYRCTLTYQDAATIETTES